MFTEQVFVDEFQEEVSEVIISLGYIAARRYLPSSIILVYDQCVIYYNNCFSTTFLIEAVELCYNKGLFVSNIIVVDLGDFEKLSKVA